MVFGGPGIFFALAKALLSEEGGVSVLLQRAGRDAIISALGGRTSSLSILFEAMLSGRGELRGEMREGIRSRLRKRRYSQSHQEWLNDNRWRFDWRSQPRRSAGTSAGGEWMDGRLDYPVARKSVVPRSQMRRRIRAMKAYKVRQKTMGNNVTRTIRSAWGDY